jgi:hypothetical protein
MLNNNPFMTRWFWVVRLLDSFDSVLNTHMSFQPNLISNNNIFGKFRWQSCYRICCGVSGRRKNWLSFFAFNLILCCRSNLIFVLLLQKRQYEQTRKEESSTSLFSWIGRSSDQCSFKIALHIWYVPSKTVPLKIR